MNTSKKATISQEQIQQTAVSLGLPDHPFIGRRIVRAFDIVESDKVAEISREDEIYRVGSQYDANKSYVVNLNHGDPSCDCLDNRTIFCKHHIASLLYANEQKPSGLILYINPINNERNQWAVDEADDYYIVRRHQNSKWTCTCGKPDCKHCKAIRENLPQAPVSAMPRVENDCGTDTAKELQDRLNGNNGTGDNQSPVSKLDANDPFQEAELLDIEQIEGRSNGDLVHVLSNGEYVISYRGIMTLAEQHKITFEAGRHDETRTVIAQGRCGNNSRASGKPINGSEMTAIELAKRNAARQLLPYEVILALQKKVQLQTEFTWEKAKAKCLEQLPEANLNCIIHDLVRDGTLRQAHPSDYSCKEWLVIFDACKRDAETNGNDDDGGDDTPSSDEQVSCAICSRTLTNPESVRLQVGPICRERIGIKGEAHLHGNIISEELLQASELYSDEALRKRIIKACLTLDAPLPVKVLNWLGNEYFGYRNRPILYYVCADRQLNRIDTHRRKLRHVIVTSATSETELDAHALAQMAVDVAAPSERSMEVPDNVSACACPHADRDEFIAKCKQAEKESAEDTVEDVDDTPTNGAGGLGTDGTAVCKLVMDKTKNITLVEADGNEKAISIRDVAFTYGSGVVLRLTQGIQLCGADVSTVELD